MQWRMISIAVMVIGCSGSHDAPSGGNEEPPPSAEPTTVVSLTFDDTRDDQFQVGAIVAARQMRATFYVNSPRVGSEGYMTAEQLMSLAQAGNEIAGHTLAHLVLANLDSYAVQHEICDDRVALLSMGFQVSTFAYPFGDETPAIHEIAEACGYTAARDSVGLAVGTSCPGCPHVETIPPADPFRIRAAGHLTSDTTLEELEQVVIDAESGGGGWVPFVFHHICDGCATNAVSPATFTAFVDWLAARRESGTGVKTVSEVLRSSPQPAASAPLPGPAANLVPNYSLERDSDDDGTPDCWQQRASGTNDATYAPTEVAHDGALAQQITISSYVDGSRRLFTRRECALQVQPDHSYQISSWYFADAAARFGVYYRNNAGVWNSLGQSDPLAASGTYVKGVFTTPPLPADTNGISVGLGIAGPGSITMDAFEVLDANAPTDITTPAVSVTGPKNGAAVSGVVTVGVAASDPDGIARVDLRVDDALEAYSDTPPFDLAWDTSRLTPGTYVIETRAFDAAGLSKTSAPVTVTVTR